MRCNPSGRGLSRKPRGRRSLKGCVTVTRFGRIAEESVIFFTRWLKEEAFVCQGRPMDGVIVGRNAKPVAYMEAGAHASFPRFSLIGLHGGRHRSAGVQSTARTGVVRSRQTRLSQSCPVSLTATQRETEMGGLSQNHGSITAVQPARRSNRTHALIAWDPVWVTATEYS